MNSERINLKIRTTLFLWNQSFNTVCNIFTYNRAKTIYGRYTNWRIYRGWWRARGPRKTSKKLWIREPGSEDFF